MGIVDETDHDTWTDDVAPRFKDIDVLLYDFEDYIETDSFEKAKFDMVQAAIKGLAIVLLDKIRTHMAEASHDERPTPTVFPPLPPIPKSATPAVLKAPTLRRPVSRHRIAPVDQQIYDSVRRTSQPSDTQPRPTTLERNPSYGDGPLPPRLPVQAGSANIASLPTGMSQLDIRASTLSVNSALPLSPESTQSQFTRYSAASSANLSPSQYRSSVCTSVPETDSSPRDDGDMSPALAKAIDTAANGGYGGYQEYRGTHPDHSNSNPNRPISESAATAREVTTTSNGADGRTTLNDELPTGSNSDTASTKFLLRARSHSRAGSSHANTHRSGDKTDDTSRASIRSGTSSNLRWGSGTAFGPNSSFGLLKGFCKGAQKFIADGPGGAVKKVGGRTQNEGPINKQDYAPDLLFSQMYSTQAGYQDEMAQCSHCEFKEIYSQLLQDMKQDRTYYPVA